MSTADEMHSVEEVDTVEDGSKAVRSGTRGRRGIVAGDRFWKLRTYTRDMSWSQSWKTNKQQ